MSQEDREGGVHPDEVLIEMASTEGLILFGARALSDRQRLLVRLALANSGERSGTQI